MASGLYTLPRRGQLSVTPHKRSAVWGGAMVGAGVIEGCALKLIDYLTDS
jgi:hypothetical protein